MRQTFPARRHCIAQSKPVDLVRHFSNHLPRQSSRACVHRVGTVPHHRTLPFCRPCGAEAVESLLQLSAQTHFMNPSGVLPLEDLMCGVYARPTPSSPDVFASVLSAVMIATEDRVLQELPAALAEQVPIDAPTIFTQLLTDMFQQVLHDPLSLEDASGRRRGSAVAVVDDGGALKPESRAGLAARVTARVDERAASMSSLAAIARERGADRGVHGSRGGLLGLRLPVPATNKKLNAVPRLLHFLCRYNLATSQIRVQADASPDKLAYYCVLAPDGSDGMCLTRVGRHRTVCACTTAHALMCAPFSHRLCSAHVDFD
ncbi:hypothetical protein EON66_01605 [archaeon]|nr:MAG: hypothetical protein EON66_01605 [archaeon]